ncbi:seryl-tRNA synthetase [Paucidesulfovibrio gracilis DSM 16080]|uniref:Serine--tRNA ligase n=1 Tax=Paucidesulfovibrio gracilis DSM 16080 TaxID=1121449 RepID=A0A1T4W5N0_9BACT|nr:serine--tRNA ligase [Paucidesulfovibrio gracilis]SKA72546.1 seryl-tRNA synthetase [Paucidesulfovibrio gracilis DSM 16080]
MLDLKFVRGNLDTVREALTRRRAALDVADFAELDERRRALTREVETLKAERNATSAKIAQKKRAKEDASDLIASMSSVGAHIKELDASLEEVEERERDWLLSCPNLLHESTPDGESEDDNPEVRRWGTPRDFDFPIKDHADLGTDLGLVDFERAAKLAGSRFAVSYGSVARMERALAMWMLDTHINEHDMIEVTPPFMVNRATMQGTGQLPKFEEDLFRLDFKDFYLIPTAEVPLTNLHAGEVLAETDLPRGYCAFTPCFRSEAGSYGKDTKGLIRQHQFQKVEMVYFAHPDNSYDVLEQMTAQAEKLLQRLELPYRVISLCTGDIGFSATKTYDLEVWLPAQNNYREISSCSNTEDFQARRADIRFQPAGSKKKGYVHTLNGSGLAVGRTLVAVLENYQQKDGSIVVPEVLRPYMGGLEVIEPAK